MNGVHSVAVAKLGGTVGANVTYLDDVLLRLGTDNDIVALNRSATLAADTAIADVHVGTVVGEALAANSFVLSSRTAGGDVAFYANRGGNSEQFFFYDTSAGVQYLTPYAGGLMVGLSADPPAPDNADMVAVWVGSAGAASFHSTVALGIESNATARIGILVPDTAVGGFSVNFVTGTPTVRGEFFYYGPSNATATDAWATVINAVERLRYSAGAFAFQEATVISTTTGDLSLQNNARNVMVGAASPPAADSKLHLWLATAGVVAAPANTVLTIENSTDAHITILGPATAIQRINFGDPGSATAGRVQYDHTNTRMALFVEDTEVLRMTSSSVTLADPYDIVLGTVTGTKIGTATTQKLGFYNATPVVQPSTTGETAGFTANTGTAVNDASTFTGNVGTTAYRLSDVVKHLKNLGLIAS